MCAYSPKQLKSESEKRSQLVRIFFTRAEFATLQELAKIQGTGLPQLARTRILAEAEMLVINAGRLLEVLDASGKAMLIASSLIRELAKDTSQLRKRNQLTAASAEKFNELMEGYIAAQQSLESAIRQVICMMTD